MVIVVVFVSAINSPQFGSDAIQSAGIIGLRLARIFSDGVEQSLVSVVFFLPVVRSGSCVVVDGLVVVAPKTSVEAQRLHFLHKTLKVSGTSGAGILALHDGLVGLHA